MAERISGPHGVGVVTCFCCTAEGVGPDHAPVVAEGNIADILEEHELPVDLPSVVARVAVNV